MNKLICAFAAALVISASVTAYSNSIQEDLQDNLVRLHIIAQSDNRKDQAVKLKVRDAVLKEAEGKSVDEITQNLDVIEKTANTVLEENGFDYRAKAVYGKFGFPKKEYKNITLPAGEYYGVRVILGTGEGHNWWCVLYPPMCTSEGDAELGEKSQELLKDALNSETYDVVTQSGGEIAVKFKTVEFIQELRQKIKR